MLKLFDTLTKSKRDFIPLLPPTVTFYHCGPTVYSHQHLGNLRAVVLADFIRRSLIQLGYDVKLVRNYTDVGHLDSDEDEGEDKMEKGIKREGLTATEIANKYIALFETDIAALNIMNPDVKPRATEYIAQMQAMIQILLENGFAYIAPEAVYFDVTKARDYTRLSGQRLEANIAGEGHGEVVNTNKRNPADFALWFFQTGAHARASQTWPSPFVSELVEEGRGLPGWHIECSAMSLAELGQTLDIHMGGVEHISVHHTNEIAQSESANATEFVRYWLHNEHLLIDNGKMAKSAGTSVLLPEVIDKGFSALDVRYFFLQSHYRSKQNFTWEALAAAKSARDKLTNKLYEYYRQLDGKDFPLAAGIDMAYATRFNEAIADDFNMPQALAILWEILKDENISGEQRLVTVLEFDNVLGLGLETELSNPRSEVPFPEEAKAMLEARLNARAAKNWLEADRLRDELKQKFNLEVKDTAQGQEVV